MLIAISGLTMTKDGIPIGSKGAGKDALADALVRRGFEKKAFADPIKEICQKIFDWDRETLYGPSHLRELSDKRYPRKHNWKLTVKGTYCECCDAYVNDPDTQCFLTTRYALKKLGTEWALDCYPNVWVDYLIRSVGTNVVVPDLRFSNEFDTLRSHGARLVRIKRTVEQSQLSVHLSETELNVYADRSFDAVVDNDGSLESLDLSATALLRTLELL